LTPTLAPIVAVVRKYVPQKQFIRHNINR